MSFQSPAIFKSASLNLDSTRQLEWNRDKRVLSSLKTIDYYARRQSPFIFNLDIYIYIYGVAIFHNSFCKVLVQFFAAGRALTVRNYFVTIFRGYVNRCIRDLVSIFYRSYSIYITR